jgi:hypothetical protein
MISYHCRVLSNFEAKESGRVFKTMINFSTHRTELSLFHNKGNIDLRIEELQ